MELKPINRRPQGFLDFFGLKSLGRNPEKFLEGVRTTVDLREWYLRTNAEQLTGVLSMAAPLTLVPTSDPFAPVPGLVVPPDEWWFIHATTLVLFGQTGFAVTGPGVMTVLNSAPNQYYEALISNSTLEYSGVLSGNTSLSYHARPRTWLPPNTQIGASWIYLDDPGPPTPGDVVNFNVHLSLTRARA